MNRREIVKRTLYDELVLNAGVQMTFREAMAHTSGEPLRLYGDQIPEIAARIIEELDGGSNG